MNVRPKTAPDRLRRLLAGTVLATALGLAGCSGVGGTSGSVRFAQSDSLGANYVVTQIGIAAVKALGYRVSLSTVNTTMFFFAAAQDDLNLSMDINFPQQEPASTAI
jgi:glycine betaine/proline transport system substrate-binding protein